MTGRLAVFGTIVGGISVVMLIVLRVVLSRPARRAVDSAIKDHAVANLSNNLERYEQMKAARARGEDITPPSAFN